MQKKKFLGFIILLFLLKSALANIERQRGVLEGVVTDAATNQPLQNATISFSDLKIDAITDKDGHYLIKSLPGGRFTVTVSYIGYKSFVGVVYVNGNTTQNFQLTVSVLESEPVVVTGVAASTQIKRAPAHISVISKQALERSAGANLLDAISKVPGVSIISTGPAIAKPSIRGLGFNRVVTLNDGVRQEGQQWGDEHGVEIDEYSAQRVEVLRGAASLMYGSDALGGVLNIITNTPVANNTVKATVSGSMNANNNMQGGYAGVAGNINGFNWNAYGSLKSAGDYKNKYDGSVLNSRFNEKNFGGYIGLNKNWGYSHLVVSNYDQHVGMVEGERNEHGQFVLDDEVPSASIQESRSILDPNQHIQHFKIALDNSFSLSNGSRITALLGFQRNQRKEFGHDHEGHDHAHNYDDEHHDDGQPAMYLDLKTINYSAAYHLPFLKDWKTSIGINGMSQENENRAQEALIPNYRLFDAGIYGYTSKTFESTTFSGGLRFDTRAINGYSTMEREEVKFSAFKKNLSSFSGSIGMAHNFNEMVTFKANISKGFRAPNLAELAANGNHEGTFRYEIGNLDLKSEDAYSIDLGLDVNTEHISLNVSPFFNYVRNYIYSQKLQTPRGQDSVINGVDAYKFSQQSANLYGVEAQLDIHPHPLDWLHFENTFSFTRGQFTHAVDGSDNLPQIAPLRLLTELRAEFPTQLNAFRNFYAKVEMDNNATQNNFFGGYNTETGTKGYTLFNVGLGSDFYFGGAKRATIIFAINNLTDVAYQNHLSRLKYAPENVTTGRQGIFNIGRNFTARLIIPFEWRLK